jgi:hypothetical protein
MYTEFWSESVKEGHSHIWEGIIKMDIKSFKPSGHCVPPGLRLQNSTFCLHSVFMCFVWISEQTAIISLYHIN